MNDSGLVMALMTTLVLSACGADTEETQAQTTTVTSTETTTSTTTVDTKMVTWVEHGVITCDNPKTRETEGPLYAPDLGDDWDNQAPSGLYWPEASTTTEHPGYGITVVDVNGDDIKDILLPFYGKNRVFIGQKDGTFTEETEERWLSKDDTRSTEALIAADINGDGFMDVAEMNRHQTNRLFINDGKGVLEHDDTVTGDMSLSDYASVGGAWGDMDLDDNLDLIVSNHWPDEVDPNPQPYVADPNQLYRLNKDGVLSQFTEWPGKQGLAYTFTSSWFDFNNDQWPDLYFGNDFGPLAVGNVLFSNVKGKQFVDHGEETWLDISMSAMGIGFGDTNHDKHPDLIVSNWGPLLHFESFGDGTWYEKSSGLNHMIQTDSGTLCCYPVWGMAMEDLDNDGDLDVPLAGGQIMVPDKVVYATNPKKVPNALFLWNGESFEDNAHEWDFDRTENHRGMVVTDINDIPFIRYSNCGDRNWMKIRLSQPGNNRYAIGARVAVSAGELDQIRWVSAGSTSFASSGPPEVHFGLDTETTVNIKVIWPDGSISTIDDIAANQTLSITRLQ
jgi:hypothetical protein